MSTIDDAVCILQAGGLVAFPTETVYGLGADATNVDAIKLIYAVKGRPSTNPLIIHVADAAVARRYAATWPDEAQKLAEAFWPGPLTLVLAKNPSIVDEATANARTVGLRAPSHPLAQELLCAFDGPLAGPSANRSTRVSPTTAQHVRQELGSLVGMVLDGGPCAVGIESTVLDLAHGPPTILRPGAVTQAQLEAVIGPVRQVEMVVDSAIAATSPGQQAVHYAPATPAYRFETSQRGTIKANGPDGAPNGLMAFGTGEQVTKWGPIVAMPRVAEIYARHFYEVLRELDAMKLHAIYIEMPPDDPQWTALRDRIRRATQPMG